MSRTGIQRGWRALACALWLMGCADAYSEIVVVNDIEERVLIRDVSFNGCLWSVVLAYGESTTPQRCAPGADRIRFEKLDTAKQTDETPLWFHYQTRSEHETGYSDFEKLEIRPNDVEQDFSVPGPHGH